MLDHTQSRAEMAAELQRLRYWLSLTADWPELQQFQPGILRRIRELKRLLEEGG